MTTGHGGVTNAAFGDHSVPITDERAAIARGTMVHGLKERFAVVGRKLRKPLAPHRPGGTHRKTEAGDLPAGTQVSHFPDRRHVPQNVTYETVWFSALLLRGRPRRPSFCRLDPPGAEFRAFSGRATN
ncbi:MAG: hypothetical protein OXR73_22640 [Myxococcales bacterium]|nr:hypothetical protein [Myxococcales bacterium]